VISKLTPQSLFIVCLSVVVQFSANPSPPPACPVSYHGTTWSLCCLSTDGALLFGRPGCHITFVLRINRRLRHFFSGSLSTNDEQSSQKKSHRLPPHPTPVTPHLHITTNSQQPSMVHGHDHHPLRPHPTHIIIISADAIYLFPRPHHDPMPDVAQCNDFNPINPMTRMPRSFETKSTPKLFTSTLLCSLNFCYLVSVSLSLSLSLSLPNAVG
jgi:hypothetical protein